MSTPKNTQTHTPTPWTIGRRMGRPVIQGDGVDICTPDLRGFGGPGQAEERDANASMIVRAVNAHDALVNALEIMVRAFNVDEIDSMVAFASIERARAALRAARGEK